MIADLSEWLHRALHHTTDIATPAESDTFHDDHEDLGRSSRPGSVDTTYKTSWINERGALSMK
jgi:hypothetical protein